MKIVHHNKSLKQLLDTITAIQKYIADVAKNLGIMRRFVLKLL